MATYRDLFRVREFRYLYAGYALSYAGDQLSSVAVAVLVFDRTGSPMLTAVAFASAFLPSVFGPLLGTFADRYPRRRVMIVCDLVRAVLVATLALPPMPVEAAIVLLYLAHVLTPPFTSARAAVMPEILSGESYITGNGLTNITYQVSQVAGFAIGGATVALITPSGALLINAATFAGSAVLLYRGVRPRSAAADAGGRSGLAHTRDGLRLLFADPWLRGCLLLVWLVPAFAHAPEAIAYPLARELGGGPPLAGMLLAAQALGFAIGALLITRYLTRETRERCTVPLAILAGAALLPILATPPAPITLALQFLCGVGCSFSAPLNAEFVRRVPSSYRGRAMGVAVGGIAAGHGAGFLIIGAALEQIASPSITIGLCGIAAITMALITGTTWRRDKPAAMSTTALHSGRCRTE